MAVQLELMKLEAGVCDQVGELFVFRLEDCLDFGLLWRQILLADVLVNEYDFIMADLAFVPVVLELGCL